MSFFPTLCPAFPGGREANGKPLISISGVSGFPSCKVWHTLPRSFVQEVASIQFSLFLVMVAMFLVEHVIACFWFGLGGNGGWLADGAQDGRGLLKKGKPRSCGTTSYWRLEGILLRGGGGGGVAMTLHRHCLVILRLVFLFGLVSLHRQPRGYIICPQRSGGSQWMVGSPK